MTINDIKKYNEKRNDAYLKDEDNEAWLLRLNTVLKREEEAEYADALTQEHPLVFIMGVPRSGTTLLTQLIAHNTGLGFINNFMARFWLAPVTGIRFSNILLNDNSSTKYESNYASTDVMSDIHEFGYFWRQLLQKDTMQKIVNSKELESSLDWTYIEKVLLNIMKEFNSGWVAKNILAAYHAEKFTGIFDKIIFINIERDLLDNCISILQARRKYYKDLNLWWSYVPLEYDQLKDLNYMEQIAGQVYYLNKFYREKAANIGNAKAMTVNYEHLCHHPNEILTQLKAKLKNEFGYDLKIQELDRAFNFRTYSGFEKEKEEFQQHLNYWRSLDTS